MGRHLRLFWLYAVVGLCVMSCLQILYYVVSEESKLTCSLYMRFYHVCNLIITVTSSSTPLVIVVVVVVVGLVVVVVVVVVVVLVVVAVVAVCNLIITITSSSCCTCSRSSCCRCSCCCRICCSSSLYNLIITINSSSCSGCCCCCSNLIITINSASNFVIYCLFRRQFQRQLRQFLSGTAFSTSLICQFSDTLWLAYLLTDLDWTFLAYVFRYFASPLHCKLLLHPLARARRHWSLQTTNHPMHYDIVVSGTACRRSRETMMSPGDVARRGTRSTSFVTSSRCRHVSTISSPHPATSPPITC